MKKLLLCVALLAVLLFPLPCSLSPLLYATTVIGTVKDANGTNLAAGTVRFRLTQEGITPDPALILAIPVTCAIADGAIQTCTVQGNDIIQPAGTRYAIRIVIATGRELLPERLYQITGATWDIGEHAPDPVAVVTTAHGSSLHFGNIFPGIATNQSLGAAYFDIGQIAVPANPAAGTRRVFVNSATAELSVRTSGGATVSLESGGGGGGGTWSNEEGPAGQINGTNVTFTLANSPSPATSLRLVYNGMTLRSGAGNDFTLSTNTITFAYPPIAGSNLISWYQY